MSRRTTIRNGCIIVNKRLHTPEICDQYRHLNSTRCNTRYSEGDKLYIRYRDPSTGDYKQGWVPACIVLLDS